MESKTREEIEKLKREWANDPTWDIEDTDGFEQYYQELREYRENAEKQWAEERKERRAKMASIAKIKDDIERAERLLANGDEAAGTVAQIAIARALTGLLERFDNVTDGDKSITIWDGR